MATDPWSAKAARRLACAVATRTAVPRPPSPIVSFTFDDIHASAATAGAAILERHGARGTFYVAGSLIGTDGPDRTAASLDQCLALHRRGHELGCHTFAHLPVARHGRAALAADLARNEAFFDRAFEAASDAAVDAGSDGLAGGRVRLRNFAYPLNTTSLRAKRQLERAFATCRGGVPGLNEGRVDLGFLRAVEIHDDGIDAAGVRRWVEQAKRRSAWLIFFTHGVRQEPQPWRCTPDLFEASVAAALDAGCEVLTIAEAAGRLGLDPIQGRRHDAEASVDQQLSLSPRRG